MADKYFVDQYRTKPGWILIAIGTAMLSLALIVSLATNPAKAKATAGKQQNDQDNQEQGHEITSLYGGGNEIAGLKFPSYQTRPGSRPRPPG